MTAMTMLNGGPCPARPPWEAPLPRAHSLALLRKKSWQSFSDHDHAAVAQRARRGPHYGSTFMRYGGKQPSCG